MAADPVAFATARLDEDEREIREDPPVGCGYALLPARMLRDVASGRRTLARHTKCVQGKWAGPYPCPELADLLYRWADHPDYEPAWKPQQ